MDAKSQSGMNLGCLMPSPDLMESAGKCWMGVMKQLYPDAVDSDWNRSMPGMEAFKAWQQWYEEKCANGNGGVQNVQTLATGFIDQQKRCSELTLAWWKCSIAALRAIGGGMKNGDHPAKIIKACMDLSEDYVRSCADFMGAQSKAIQESTAAMAPESGSEKAKSVKVKTT